MPQTGSSETIQERLQTRFNSFTRAERQIANMLLENYPMAGLGSITAVARSAEVSTPSVVRMAQKLGFEGFGDFQEALRAELSEQISSPLTKRETWVAKAPDSHMLNRFTEAATANIRQTLAQVDPAAFDLAAERLADPERKIYVAGGRITRSLADYLYKHLQVIRADVLALGSAADLWPHHLLDLKEGDVVVLFDIRRYENVLLRLAELAHERGAQILLFTDQWGSPIVKLAQHRFNCRVEVPSAWDSNIAILLVMEALISAVQELTWKDSKERMETLEGLFDRTRLFRKFV